MKASKLSSQLPLYRGYLMLYQKGPRYFQMNRSLTVRAPAIEAQLIETYVLLTVNHQSMIATKANRIWHAAEGRTVLEFGSRRVCWQMLLSTERVPPISVDAGTACTLSEIVYGVPAGGTMAHSWVQMFDSEYESFGPL